MKRISFEEGKRLLDENPAAVLVDVRTEEEYEAAHAMGAVLLTLEEFTEEDAWDLLPEQEAPVILYCRTGRRSAQAALKLQDMGYTALYDMGGLNGWPYGMDHGNE